MATPSKWRGGYGSRVGLYLAHPSSLEHETGAHPENAAPAAGDRGDARGRRLARARAGRGAAGDAASSFAASTPTSTSTRSRVLRRGRRADRRGHGRQRALLRGGAPRRRRRGRRRRAAARRARTGSRSAACARPAITPSGARDGLLPVQQRRRRRRARARASAAPSGSWCWTGTSITATGPRRSSPPPTGCSTRASTSGRSTRGPGPRRLLGRGGGGGIHGQPARAARGRLRGLPLARPARGRARSRAPSSPG